MSKIIAFSNQKGGIGKTTSAVNIAASVAHLGKKVLLCDLDPQGNATSGFGISRRMTEVSTYDVLIGQTECEEAIVNTNYNGVDVIPSRVNVGSTFSSVFTANSFTSV